MAFRSPRFPALLLLAACACAYRPDERDPKLDVSKQRANSSSPQLRTTKTDIATATATDPTKPRKLKEVTAVTGEKTASNLGSGSGFSSSSSSRSSAADARSVSSVRQEEKDEQQHERTRSSSTSSTNNNNDNSAPGSSKKTGEHARVSLSLESLEKSTKYDGASAFQVRVSMRNIDTQGLIFARFDSPFTESSHGIENKLFLVEPKHAARFKGRMVDRRNHFRKNDFSTLAPNETVTAEFDLRHYLAFSKLGKVTISIRFDLVSSEYHEQKYLDAHNPPEGYNMSGLVETLVSSNAIELDVTDTKHQHHRINRYAQEVERLQQEHTANGSVGVGISFLREKGVLASRKLENGASISYVSCRADQIHIINSAIHLARQMAYSSDYFNENGLQQNKLVEWFGGTTYQSSISNDYDQIYEHQIGTSYSFSCACDVDGTYAYIYPDDRSKTIYLCNEFWRAPSNQDRDCQAGTILHEMSHFYDVADTNDNAYGTTAIKELAMTDHLAASQNADTFEAFSEDTPNIGGNVNFPTSFPTPAGASMAPSSYSSTTTSNECFAGGSTLLLESGKRIAIQDVRVGDRVQVPTGIASVDSDSDSDSDFSRENTKHSVSNVGRVRPLSHRWIVLTRDPSSKPAHVVAPVLDLMQPHPSAQLLLEIDEKTGSIRVVANEHVIAGSRVKFRPPPPGIPNEVFLTSHGYVPEINTNDFVVLKGICGEGEWRELLKQVESGDAIATQKFQLLKIFHEDNYSISAFTIPPRLLMALRIMYVTKSTGVSFEELKDLVQSDKTRFFSVINEVQVAGSLLRSAEEMLLKFPTTMDEDTHLLQAPTLDDDQRLAIEYRRSKKALLHQLKNRMEDYIKTHQSDDEDEESLDMFIQHPVRLQ
mmetsp:Transcript_2915/g.5398  ORF Transcript_2915/g.5398 Transcript_2915/m.5398 type:complete len:881 (-) Transcript_2915:24-2666(-)